MNARTGLMLVALFTAGCGGGPSGSTSVPAPAGGTQSGTLSLTFAAPAATSAVSRKPLFVSPNATSAIVTINSLAPQTFNIGATSTLCTTAGNVRTCTIPLTAPFGQSSFAVSLMGTAGSNTVLLGQGSNSATVVSGTNFSLTVGINPMVASVNTGQVSTACCYTFGMANSQSSSITFADATGANITGSGNVPNFLSPVTLTSSDPSFTLSPATLTTPGQNFQVVYSGSPSVAQSVTITAKVGTLTLASETFQMPGLFITRFNLGALGTIDPQQIVQGPDGNVWVAETLTNLIARVTPAGVITTFATGFAAGHGPLGVTAGQDGNIYYSDNNSCNIGRMNTSGVQQGGLAAVMGGGCNLWQLGNDGATGDIWFVDSSHNALGFIPTSTWPSPGAECGNLPTAFSFSTTQQITQGPDGAMWFTEGGNGHKIGRYANAAACSGSVLTEYTPPSAGNHDLGGLVVGADNNLWFGEVTADLFAKITAPGGVITEYPGLINSGNFASPTWLASSTSNGDLYTVQGGGAITWSPSNPATAFQQMFVDANGKEGQTVMNSAINGPGNQVWFSGYGAANGGGFIPTQDEVAEFVPR